MAYTTIDDPSEYFNTVLFTGNGANDHAITGVGFQPDWVWLKGRNAADGHNLWDINRGVNKRIFTHNANAELADTNSLKSFDSDGFTMDNDTGINGSGDTYVTWNWLASNTTASNSDGSITSTVSANQTSGFSIVTYTGTGSNATVGHGLGTVPTMILFKNRTSGSTNWIMYHSFLGASKAKIFNTESASFSAGDFNNTSPTSSVFSIGTSTAVSENTSSIVSYCFSDVKGYQKAFNYIGNGSADGAYCYLGFKPTMVIIIRSDSARNHVILDTKRDTFNPVDSYIHPNSDGTEAANSIYDVDFLSNGIKIRNNNATWNSSGGEYFGIAIASNPFVSSEGVPVTAR